MVEVSNSPGNGLKAFGGVAAIAAVILGVYAMVEPMNQRIDYVKSELTGLQQQLAEHSRTDAHSGTRADLARIHTKFAEVETQFKGLREITASRLDRLETQAANIEQWAAAHDLRVAPLNARQWSRIEALERVIFGKMNSTEK